MNNPDGHMISNNITCQIGFHDSTGEIFIVGDRIIRGIYPQYGEYIRRLLNYCIEKNIFSSGIVNTWEIEESLFSNDRFGLLLEHTRVPFISYPHEWPASMFKKSALFHIGLNIDLSEYDLMLADIHPYNILFRETHPIFVDFPSLIFSDDLMAQIQEMHFPLKNLCIRPSLYLLLLYIGDFFPYFLGPLYIMTWQHHNVYHSLGKDTRKVFPYPGIRFRELIRYRPSFCITAIRSLVSVAISLLERDHHKKKFWHTLYRQVARVTTQPILSSIPGKVENRTKIICSTSLNKEVMHRINTGSVLDLGNQGGFSIAAAEAGCSVVAIDTDENCMDQLYIQACQANLTILPLVIDPASIFASPSDFDFPGQGWDWGYLPLSDRLRCDTVIVGPGIWPGLSRKDKSMKDVVSILDRLTLQTLLLIVPLEGEGSYGSSSLIRDALVSFFPLIEFYDTSDPELLLIRCEKTRL
jgi:hypothetical protein